MRTALVATAAVAGLLCTAIGRADAADAAAGKAYAAQVCAPCHAVGSDDAASVNLKAPPFKVVANSKLVTSREIDIWLQTAHPDMPDLVVPAEKRADLIAYIDSLGGGK